MRVEIKGRTRAFDGFFKIEESRVAWEQFDGSMGPERTRYVIRRGDSVGVLPVCNPHRSIVLVKQFRYPAVRQGSDGYLWEIPAGMVEKDESPAATAHRELQEETGVEPESMEYSCSFFLSPGAMDEKFHLFIASISNENSIHTTGGSPEEDEDLLVKTFTQTRVREMIQKNRIMDAKTMCSLLYYFDIYSNKK
ncbi:MAG: NUDIX domain-containing protein [Spirochaetota bacterium]